MNGEWEKTGGEAVIVYLWHSHCFTLDVLFSYTAELPYSESLKSWITVRIGIEENNVLGFNAL